jgi:4-alpha-glucanotransferase
LNLKNVSHQLCRIGYASVSNMVILPMQDVLGLNETSRMNMPATASGNWKWRMKKNVLTNHISAKLNSWCFHFDRQRK